MSETEKSNAKSDSVKAIRTFESDFAETINKKRTSAADIVIAETDQQSYEPLQREEAPAFFDGKMITIISAVFLLATGATYGAYIYLKPEKPPSAPMTSSGQSIISIDTSKVMDLNGSGFPNTAAYIKEERENMSLRLNSVGGINFIDTDEKGVKRAIITRDFLKRIAPNISEDMLWGFDDGFAFGFLSYNGNQPFLILKTPEFQKTYAGMIKNERNFYRDAGSIFFDPKTAPRLPTSTAAYFNDDPRNQIFSDITIKNKDARVVKNEKGEIVLLYAFPDSATLIITTNSVVYEELLERLKRK